MGPHKISDSWEPVKWLKSNAWREKERKIKKFVLKMSSSIYSWQEDFEVVETDYLVETKTFLANEVVKTCFLYCVNS